MEDSSFPKTRRSITRPSGLPVARLQLPTRSLLVVLAISGYIISAYFSKLASASPPVDFFRYTSTGDGQLESLRSIYNDGAASQELADRLLGLVKNSSHTHDNNQIDLDASRLAWHLMERQALLYMQNRVFELKPLVGKLLDEARVTGDCRHAVDNWFDGLARLELWASVMWNSWGDFPPAGLYEGSFTDLGSYPGCFSVQPNELIGEPQYCMLDFQPLVPTRPRFHSILKRVLGVDPQTGRLTGGDFDGAEPKISAQHSAHTFEAQNSLRKPPQSSPSTSKDNSTTAQRNKKRYTIDNNSPRIDNYKLDPLNSSNLTIKAEALIELANRAQYFYYVKFRLGACLPSKCTQSDVQKIAQTAGQRAILQSSQVNCLKKEPFKLNGYQVVAIVILSSLALVSFLGTLVDLLGFKASDSSAADWLLLFSIWANGKKLFDVYTNGTHADLEVVHGLRFFSMIWVIYGHTVLYTEYQAFTHFFDVVETKIGHFGLLASLNANFSVDTFFVISGVLTTYVTWEFMRGDPRRFNKVAFAVSRYIRLTPQLAIIILLFFLLPLMGEGPLYKQVTEYQADLCYKGWLTNLLYLQTYQESEKICIDPSWWLSIEMSFHLISILVISVMVRNVYGGMVLNFSIAAILTGWGAIVHFKNGFAIAYLPSVPQRYEIQSEQTRMFFHRLYPHAASYFMGTALGYILATRTIKRLTRCQLIQGWFICATGIILSLWGTYFWNLGAPYTQWQATLYYHACQILWPLSISWIIFVSSLGQGGIVHSVLSAPVFAPLGRITYMTYLSHALIIYYHAACRNVPIEPSVMSFVYSAISNIVLSLLLGVILTLVYESPLLNLQKQLVNYLTKKFDPTRRANNGQRPEEAVVLEETCVSLTVKHDQDTQDGETAKEQANANLLRKCLLNTSSNER